MPLRFGVFLDFMALCVCVAFRFVLNCHACIGYMACSFMAAFGSSVTSSSGSNSSSSRSRSMESSLLYAIVMAVEFGGSVQ